MKGAPQPSLLSSEIIVGVYSPLDAEKALEGLEMLEFLAQRQRENTANLLSGKRPIPVARPDNRPQRRRESRGTPPPVLKGTIATRV